MLEKLAGFFAISIILVGCENIEKYKSMKQVILKKFLVDNINAI
jgi:hypothetical protein